MMESGQRAKIARLIAIAGLVLIFDQVTKFVVRSALPLHMSVSVIPGFFNLTHVQNPGGAFGLLAAASPFVRQLFFLLAAGAAAVFIAIFYLRTPATHRALGLAFALLFGGAIGNLIDRIRFGSVTDFFLLYWNSVQWPAFNVADSAITIGIVIFVYHALRNRLPE